MIKKIFFPYYQEKLEQAVDQGFKFVQYTTAPAALSIIQNQELWLRNTRCMNDFSEVAHGLSNLIETYNGKHGQKLKSVLNALFPDITQEIEKQFNGWIPYFKGSTFITCISEHPPEENTYGRLSMWRAYGGENAVAIVLNAAPFIEENDIFHAYTNPVAYLDYEHFSDEIESLSKRIENHKEYLKTFTKEKIVSLIFEVFKGVALCSKHPGFLEEREWRMVYNPKYEQSNYMKSVVEIVDGVPQEIFKIPLRNYPEAHLSGTSLPEFVDRIIIGPSDQQQILLDAFARVLGEAGCENPYDKIFVSGIPLR